MLNFPSESLTENSNSLTVTSESCESVCTITPLIPPDNRHHHHCHLPDMPPSYSGLMDHGEVVFSHSPPCYQVSSIT